MVILCKNNIALITICHLNVVKKKKWSNLLYLYHCWLVAWSAVEEGGKNNIEIKGK